MAYCLRSFVETLEQVLYPHQHHKKWVLDHDQRPQIQSLFQNATVLRDFLDKASPLIQEQIASLEIQIMEAAEKGAYTLESHITSQILSSPDGESFTIYPPDLGEVIRVFEDAKHEVYKIKDISQPARVLSSKHYLDSMNIVVGVEEDLKQLRSRLTSARASKLHIVPIIGMGGTGKTTLARILYDEYSSTKSHFDRCAWVTVSQSYDLQQVLKTLLACVTETEMCVTETEMCVTETEMSHQETKTNELIVTLFQTLFGRRYLIVVDDIWSCKAWDDVQRCFPQDNQGSRVILTTRENNVANYVKSNSHEMHLINDDDSWVLLRRKVFGEESCPRELEEVGKRIAKSCGGLPLALQVIGGFLAHSQRSEDCWEDVAYNVNTLLAKTDDQFAGIFSLSFSHLPHYLKPCFLYMGAFPEDHVIRASRLIRLWVAEGFLYPVLNKTLEEAAETHLSALADRNLIFVRSRKKNGKPKSYGIHDLLRDLCLRKAQEKKFLHVKDSKTKILTLCPCRVSIHLSHDSAEVNYGSLKLTPHLRSFILTGRHEEYSNRFMSCLCFKSSLLRVLDVYASSVPKLQQVFLHLVNLRYLALSNIARKIPVSISACKNLQTLIVNFLESIAILVDLPLLRHLKFNCLKQKFYERSFDVHLNLQRLSRIPLKTLVHLLGKLPKLRQLGIDFEMSDIELIDLTSFQELETLTCMQAGLFSKTIFPYSLKQLIFFFCNISQTLLDIVGVLPGLEVLVLEGCMFERSTWEPSEGGFCQLQYLRLDGLTVLKKWLATEIHYPVLKHLVILACDDLNEIPNDIGGIETLETIQVDRCKASVVDSARRIVGEQREFGNTLLNLRLGSARE